MGMKMTTPLASIYAYIDAQAERIEEEAVSNLEYAGEQAVATARQTQSYTDRSGNLRSSVGYVVVKDGEIVRKSGFVKVKDGDDGVSEGERFAVSLAGRYPEGIVLIVVAGKNYAVYVARKGYDVLDSAQLEAENILEKLSS